MEKGLQVLKAKTAAGKIPPTRMDGFMRLIEQKYFVVDRFELGKAKETVVSFAGPGCLVALSGSGVVIARDGDVELIPRQAVVVPVGSGTITVKTDVGVSFVRCEAPA